MSGYREHDPSTSKGAFYSIDATALEHTVCAAIIRRGGQGANWWELHQLTGLALASISPRFKPLRQKNKIKALMHDGKVVKRPGATNRNQIVWVAV